MEPLFDRQIDSEPGDDAWESDRATWRRSAAATVPPGRFAFGMVFDAGRGRIAMAGGVGARVLGETR
ncbi:MAG: hypothetical protein IPM29_24450 [Planctomycetes bacterium]|nr:hypothetical protein [Planctomycetota bacterium]